VTGIYIEHSQRETCGQLVSLPRFESTSSECSAHAIPLGKSAGIEENIDKRIVIEVLIFRKRWQVAG